MYDRRFAAAVWYGARDIRVEARQSAALSAHELRIKVAKCGICGSDLHEYVNGPHAIPVLQEHPLSRRKAPIVLGHEFCGTVSEVGSSVIGFRMGQRVAIEPEYRCGSCSACQRGDYNLCESMGFAGLMGDGGMAEEATVPAYMAYALPDEVSFTQAAVLEPAAVALHALRRSGLGAGMRCAVVGAGPIGLLIVQLAKLAGAREIAVSDLSDARLQMATDLGATIAVNTSRDSLSDHVQGVDVSFEAVGVQSALTGAFNLLRKGGRLVLVGLFGKSPSLDAFKLVNREIDLISSVGYRHVYSDLIALVAAGLFDPSRIVTREIQLGDVVQDGFERLLSNPADVKIIVTQG
ncbi:2,3-butanediol dehydrogenase [Bradyrhizobium sp. HKCCYLRH1073]|uniref:2,3-butanediol dehydrogenase n=1 Tax=unclassified Bradyrhizobium TaxID=2631580 RepID=UPI002915EE4D|nr:MULTISPECIES: 2,3-butanediol dehydrogenase [unclassified Bradyrhizobium]